MRALFFALLALSSASARAQDVIYSGTLRGDLVVTGNTLGLDASTATAPGTGGGIGTFIANPRAFAPQRDGTYPVGTTADYTQNGSEAVLDLPDGARVVAAQLIWACSSQTGGLPATPLTTPSSVYLTLPGGTQQTVSVQAEDTTLSLYSSIYRYYQRRADVTGAITVGGAGRYLVSRVVGTEHADTSNLGACGWSLFVVYAHPDLPMRNITLWNVGEEVRDDGANCPCEVEIPVSGFCTPQGFGAANGRMVVAALEGDARWADDALMIADPLFPGEFYPLSGPNNAVDNFFASQVNGDDGYLDNRGTFGTSNHQLTLGDTTSVSLVSGARQGFDITTIPLNDWDYNPYVLENGQSETSLLATSGGVVGEGDDYIIAAMGIALDFDAPDLGVLHETDHAVTTNGDTVTFEVTLVNEGYGRADDVTFCYRASANATFGGLAIDGVPVAGVSANALSPERCTAETGGFSIGAFEPLEEKTLTLSYLVDSLVAAPAPLDRVTGTPSWRLSWRPSCDTAEAEVDRQVGEPATVPGIILESQLAVNPVTPPAVLTGDTLTYTLTVRNRGAADSPPTTTVRLPVPAGSTYVAGSTTLNGEASPDASGAPYDSARTVRSANAPDGVIRSGTSAVLTFRVKVSATAATTISATADVDPDGQGSLPAKPSNTVLTLVSGPATDDDQDDDDVPDADDNCVYTWNTNQENHYDDNGFNPFASDEGDACDDTDGDGLLDLEEDPDFDGPEATQTDARKPDTDGDGLCDGALRVGLCVGVEDRDGDKQPIDWGLRETSPIDPDTDDDGICDGVAAGGPCLGGEQTQASNPLMTDTDRDGLCDGPGGDDWDLSGCKGSEVGVDGTFEAGTDTDPADPDTDGDGLCDGFANGTTDCERFEDQDGDRDPGDFNGLIDPETDPLSADTDKGGVNDGVEILIQGTNPRDRCEGDLVNCLEGDADNDTIPDGRDNCPFVPNTDQADTYPAGGNGIGDACDDVDKDGLKDLEEVQGPDGTRGTGDDTDPENPDTDGDGLCDGHVIVSPCVGVEDRDGDFDGSDRGVTETDPNDPDTDDDGLCDGLGNGGPCLAGEDVTATNPLDSDSDDDGLCDGPGGGAWDQSGCLGSETGTDGYRDVGIDTDPTNPDTDADGLCDGFRATPTCSEGEDRDGDRTATDFAIGGTETDPLNPDTDRGGTPDGVEVEGGTDPRDPCDGDGQLCDEAFNVEGGGCGGASTSALAGWLFAALLATRRPRRSRA
jgi:uncharacterized repeat protein (TIGR01451 family)